MSLDKTDEEIITVLVTGASGYIGTHIVQLLLRTGHAVRGTVHSLKNQQKIDAVWEMCPGPQASNRLLLVQADLLDDRCWDTVIEGCSYVLHVASPTPMVMEQPSDEEEIIKPAVQGTLSLLKACAKSTTVKRVIMTSSIAAISGALRGGDYTEHDWADVNQEYMGAYAKSKVLAEQAAWEFVRGLTEEDAFDFVVLHPGIVIGPAICGTLTSSLEIGRSLMMRTVPLIAKINFPMVDVRDVAMANLRAMTVPGAAGKRIILTAGNLWYREMAYICEEEFGPQGYIIPTCEAPDFLVRFMGRFTHGSKFYIAGLSEITHFDNRGMRRLLGMTPIDMTKSVIDMCYSLVERGFIEKTEQYTRKK